MSAQSLEAAKDSLKTTTTVAVGFVFATLYVLVAAISTTHVQLLLGRDLELVPLGADVPLLTFFRWAPWVYVSFHLFLLIQLDTSSSALRTVSRDWAARIELSSSTLARVLVGDWARRPFGLDKGVFLALVVFLPQFLLAHIQVWFLPYHLRPFLHVLHQLPLLVDSVICLLVVPRALLRSERSPRRWDPVRLFVRGWSALVGAFVVVMVLSPAQGGWLRQGTCRILDCNLDVADQELVSERRASSWLEIAGHGKSHRTLNLTGRDLSEADFSRTSLVGADLRGADLEKAKFIDADLRGADFSPLDMNGSSGRTILVDADLSGATLRGARLSRSLLGRADFAGADLRGAVLERADLQAADLTGTRLEAAGLSYSTLSGSRLDGAHLTCADLEAVRAEGVTAAGVVAIGVELRRARLQGATFVGADLLAADLTGAAAEGASFRSASLDFSRGLPLLALDLRFADVSGALTYPWDERGPHLTDARGVQLASSSDSGRARLETSLAHALERLDVRGALARIADCRRSVEDRLAGGSGSKTEGVQEQLEKYWWTTILLDETLLSRAPKDTPIQSERSYHEELAKGLLKGPDAEFAGEADLDVCSSWPIAASVLLRAQGCSAPRDPDLERHLRRRLSELVSSGEECPALVALAATSDSIRKRSGRTEAEPEWPSSERFPRWPRLAVDCIELHDQLWRQVAQ